MATNTNNLGYRVTTRNLSYEQMVREAWGSDWGKRDVVYEFGTRVDSDNTKSGIYGVPECVGIVTMPMNPTYADMPIRIMTELNQLLGVDTPIRPTLVNQAGIII